MSEVVATLVSIRIAKQMINHIIPMAMEEMAMMTRCLSKLVVF